MKQVDSSKFTPQEQREYEAGKMAYRDIKNSIDTARREGKEEGLAEGMEQGMSQRSNSYLLLLGFVYVKLPTFNIYKVTTLLGSYNLMNQC